MSRTDSRPSKKRSLLRTLLRVLVFALGSAILALTVRDVGAERLWALAVGAAQWMPLALALEGVRIGLDALATRFVLGERGRVIPFHVLYRAQLAGHGVMGVFPAGRSASEVAKAALLSEYVGAEAGAAMGATNQANVLTSSALFSLLCLGAVQFSRADERLSLALAIHTIVLLAAGLGTRVLATSPYLERKIARRFPSLEERLASFHDASRDTRLIEPLPVLAMFAARGVQTLQYAVLALSVGIDVGVPGALAVQGVNLVATAVGVLVPGQIGTAELVFHFAAEALDTTDAQATAIALLSRVPQFSWICIGLLTLLLWKRGAVSPTAKPSRERAV